MDRKRAEELLTGRCKYSRKIGNNTYLKRRYNHNGYRTDGKEPIALLFHNTDILTFLHDGAIEVSTGGWDTVTTRARLNKHLPNGWVVFGERGATILSNRYPWQEGKGKVHACVLRDATITAEGKVEGGGDIEEYRESIRNADNERNRLRSRARYWIRKARGLVADRSACKAGSRWDCGTRRTSHWGRREQLQVGTYKCGCRVYHETPKVRLTIDGILKEENQTVRTAMIHVYGLERFVVEAKAETLDTHGDYTLLQLPNGEETRANSANNWARGSWQPRMRVLKMVCPSTGASYIATVPPNTAKVAEALDWIFNTENYLGQVTQQA